jgi:ORF6N domain
MIQPKKPPARSIAAHRPVEKLIHIIRGEKVMLDADLAALYGVPTKVFNQAVRRNRERFPEDFMFQLSHAEAAEMRSQFVTSSKRGMKYQPLAFTEHGVAMLSSVLNSERAIQMNIAVIRAFVRMRQLIEKDRDIAARVEKLEDGQSRAASVIEVLAEDIDRLAHEVKEMKALPRSRSARSVSGSARETDGLPVA